MTGSVKQSILFYAATWIASLARNDAERAVMPAKAGIQYAAARCTFLRRRCWRLPVACPRRGDARDAGAAVVYALPAAVVRLAR